MWHVKLLQLQRTAARTQNPVAEGVNKQGDWQGDGGGTPWRPQANITVSLSDVRSKGTQGWLNRGKGEEMYRRRDRLLTPELALRCAG